MKEIPIYHLQEVLPTYKNHRLFVGTVKEDGKIWYRELPPEDTNNHDNILKSIYGGTIQICVGFTAKKNNADFKDISQILESSEFTYVTDFKNPPESCFELGEGDNIPLQFEKMLKERTGFEIVDSCIGELNKKPASTIYPGFYERTHCNPDLLFIDKAAC